MKRWKNRAFRSSGNAEPPSIGITLIAVDKFVAVKEYQPIESVYKYDDLEAILSFAKEIQKLFIYDSTLENGRKLYKIEYCLPASLNFEPNSNIFRKMSTLYMTDFKDKIDDLVSDLEKVKYEVDEVKQCKKLNEIFGDDFKVPEKKDVAKKQMNYIPPTSSSGVL